VPKGIALFYATGNRKTCPALFAAFSMPNRIGGASRLDVEGKNDPDG